MAKKKDVTVFKMDDGGIFILQRPATLARKKREAVKRLESKREEAKRRGARFETLTAGG